MGNMVRLSYNDHTETREAATIGAILKIESTKAKARFASLATQARANDVAITRHGCVQAYVLSPARYAHLAAVDRVGADVMQKLDDDFDALVKRMQSPAHTRVVKRLASAPLDAILADTSPSKPARKARGRKQST